MTTKDDVRELATQHGFISGARTGDGGPDLWVKDFDTPGVYPPGYTSIYPARGGWIVTFTGVNSDIPYASEWFRTAEQAFRYATS